MHHHVTHCGDGSTVILIHGLGGNLNSWDVVTDRLEKRFTVYRYDLRGHGKSDNPKGPWLLADFIDDLQQIVKHNEIQNPRLVGFSLGGLIAQGYAIKHSQKVEKLVILSAVAGRTEAERMKVQQRIKNLENNDLETNMELAMERWFSEEFRQQYPEKAQARMDTLKSNDAQGYLNAYRVFGLGDLADQIHHITCPTLIMTGEHDPGSNVRMAELMHQRIKNSQLKILPNLRHSVLVENPHLIAQRVNEFL